MEYIKAKMVILSLRRGAVINPAQQRRTLWAFVFYYHLSYCARMGLYIYLYPPFAGVEKNYGGINKFKKKKKKLEGMTLENKKVDSKECDDITQEKKEKK
jgi:hypothetical protein